MIVSVFLSVRRSIRQSETRWIFKRETIQTRYASVTLERIWWLSTLRLVSVVWNEQKTLLFLHVEMKFYNGDVCWSLFGDDWYANAFSFSVLPLLLYFGFIVCCFIQFVYVRASRFGHKSCVWLHVVIACGDNETRGQSKTCLSISLPVSKVSKLFFLSLFLDEISFQRFPVSLSPLPDTYQKIQGGQKQIE